ncbi:hypothetical protein EH223_17030 [candidate division KSB1 bacterium]|nr:peptidylprolyl isomerase [candidate division KSB1 bacterium]RQW00857.1 MAG: hypothetical protein EH223_17030 [candidate division KSB1 bacterium]
MKLGKIVLSMITLVIVLAQMSVLFSQTYVYINVPEENLRNAPNGRKIGALLENTEMVAIDEKENWVQVQLTGWIWKPSLSTIKTTITGDYRALHIMVKTKAEAEAITKELTAGKEFAELARTKSAAPSAAIGGDLGYFNKGDFNPVFENAILALKVDQVSDIIEVNGTFNIFKRLK